MDHQESKRAPEKHLLCIIDYTKTFDCVDHNKLWKILKEMDYQSTLPDPWEICMQVKKQQFDLEMEQKTGYKLRKEYGKAVYHHPASLTYMKNTSFEMLGWMKYKLGSKYSGEKKKFQEKYQ